MPSMKTMWRSGALAVLAALGTAGVAGAQLPGREAREHATAAVEMARAQAELALEQSAGSREQIRASMEMARAQLAQTRMLLPQMSAEMTQVGMGVAQTTFATRAPEPWIQEDPAVKEYRAARQALSDGKYQDAVKRFAALRRTYPSSAYVADSYYWQAFALYRVGGRSDLHSALELLAAQAEKYPKAQTLADADNLRVRLEAQLARQGDAAMAEAVTQQATDPCKSDEQSVRLSALSALMNMNADQAVPILKEVLKGRDTCSAQLRKQAVFLLSQKMTPETIDILLDLAHRNPDPDPEVREQAVFWLSQVRSPQAVDALESILKDSKDEAIQEKAIFALSQQGSDRAAGILKSYVERPDAPAKLRENAIFWIGQSSAAGAAKYLMELYPRLQTEALKEKTIASVGQAQSAEGRAWLLARAKDGSESVDVRKTALFWAGQSGALEASELKDLYASLAEPAMKKQVIFAASQSNDKAAVDFLMEVVKTEKDPELRKSALFWLGQSKDPRVAEFLLSLIRG